jgi:hypothetical protein
VSGNEIAKLAENGELAGGWLVAGFLFHALPCGKPQTRKPTFFIPQPSFRWDTNVNFHGSKLGKLGDGIPAGPPLSTFQRHCLQTP